MPVYLTPASLGYLAQFVLAILISGYFIWLSRQPQQHLKHIAWLTVFFVAFSSFIAACFLETALMPTQRLYAVYMENVLLAVALAGLLQFAYHFPALPPTLRLEARVVLILSGLYALFEGGVALYRFIRLDAGEVLYRAAWSDYYLLLFFLWIPVVFIRQIMLRASPGSAKGRSRLKTLLRPTTPETRAASIFALIFAFAAALNLLSILQNYFFISAALANTGISAGILLALYAFTVFYLNYLPEMTSFLVKIAGTTLTTMLAILGIVGWVISPSYAADYHPVLPDQRTLRFTPNELGGYDLAQLPLAFETDLGDRLALTEYMPHDCSPSLGFTFPFYGQTYHQVFACNDGALSLGKAVSFRNYQYRYGGGAPLIAPLVLDLYPEIGPGGVYVRQTDDRLVVTWAQVRGFALKNTEFTFQLILYPNGVFDFNFNGLPPASDPNLRFLPNDDPFSNVWFSGIIPGGEAWNAQPQIANLSALPLRSGPQGLVQDYRLEFRQHLAAVFLPLATLILVASLFIVTSTPLLFYFNLVKPLNALLGGVQRMMKGDYSTQLPVYTLDEVGFLAQSFNSFQAQLRSQVYNRKLIESNPFPLVVVRLKDAAILVANQATADYLQMPLGQLVASNWQGENVDQASYQAAFEEFNRLGSVKNKIIRLQTSSGEPRIALLNLLAIEWEGEDCLVAGLADITTRSQVEASLRQSAERWASIYRASEQISASLDEENVYRAVHEAVRTIMRCDDFAISLYNAEQNQEIPVYVVEQPEQRLALQPREIGQGLANAVILGGQSFCLNNQEEKIASGIELRPNTDGRVAASLLAAPMWLSGKPIGMIAVQSYRENAYMAEDEDLLEVLAIHAAIALENARLFKRIRREMFERQRAVQALAHQKAILEAINTAARFFLSGEEWQSQLDNMLESLGQATQVTHALIYQNRLDETGNFQAQTIARWKAVGTQHLLNWDEIETLPMKKTLGRWLMLMAKRQGLIGLAREFPVEEEEFFAGLGFVSLAAVPIFVGQGWWGFFIFADCYTEKRWDLTDVEILETSADMLGVAIHRQQVEEQLRLRQIELTAAGERERMGRDLHDGLGQALGFINVQAQAVQTLLKGGQTEAAGENLGRLAQAAQESHADLRNYILGLRREPSLPHGTFHASLQIYLREFSQTWNIETALSLPPGGLPPLPGAVEDQLLHIVQEALVNIRKHAGARRAEVLITFLANEIVVMVTDDGQGFEQASAPGAEQGHFGLGIMRERAEQIGGRLEIRSEPGQGTQILIAIPQTLPGKAKAGDLATIYGLRILLVDDQPLFLDGLRNLCMARGLTVIGLAHDGMEALEQVRVLRPEVVIMDVEMPGCNGLEATRLIKAEFPDVKVVLLTVAESNEHFLDAIRNRADGYLLKSLDANDIFTMLAEIVRGEMQISTGLAPQFLAEFSRPAARQRSESEMKAFVPPDLTMRQWEVLRLVARGQTYKEVGIALHLTERAVKYHMAQIVERLHLQDRDQAVEFAQKFLDAQKKKG